jgi:hypothetical protein
MGTVLWDAEGCILLEYLPQGGNIDALCYLQMLQKLWRAVRDKCGGKKTIIIKHNSAQSHSACLCMEMI